MRNSERDLLHVINDIYAAAAGQQRWTGATKTICDYFSAAGGWIFDIDRNTHEVANWTAYRIEATASEWVDHIKAIDPRLKFTFTHPAGEVDHDARFITEREMDRHEFYDWQMREAGTRYFLGSRLRDDGDISTFASFTFTPSHSAPESAEVERFGLVCRHLDTAWRLWKRSADGVAGGLPAFISERIPWGIVSLDSRRKIVAMNRNAERIVAARDGLAAEKGHLFALRSAENRTLQGAIALALGSNAISAGRIDSALSVPRKNGLPGYVIQVLPFIDRTGAPSPGAVIYILDPAAAHSLRPETLQSAFRLSAREAALAVELANGASVMQAADRLGISYNTARIHLQQVFRKTGTHNQAGLSRLLASMVETGR